jgi:hypothetical protein
VTRGLDNRQTGGKKIPLKSSKGKEDNNSEEKEFCGKLSSTEVSPHSF